MMKCDFKWCASNCTNSITLKKMTAEAIRWPRGTYHDTWADAYDALVGRRRAVMERAQRDLAAATRALAKARALQPPKGE
jgi:hypothetical protein